MRSTTNNDRNSQRRPEWDRILSASQRNDATEINNLITNQNVSPNHSNVVGQSALHVAVLWGNVEATRALLSNQADTNAQNRISGATPLLTSVQSAKNNALRRKACRRTACTQLLLDNGANPYIKDYFGLTPLQSLENIISNHMEVSQTGITENKTENDDGDELKQYMRMKQVLISAMEATERNDRSWIFSSIDQFEIEKMNLYFNENKADDDDDDVINIPDIKTGLTPLLYTVERIVDKETKEINDIETIEKLSNVVSLLLENGANTNAVPETRKNASIELNIVDTGKFDVDIKAPLDKICEILHPIHAKYKKGHQNAEDDRMQDCLEKIAMDLYSHGASLSIETKQLLHDASRRGYLQSIRFFTQTLGIDPNTKGRQGFTPLHFAARTGNVDVVKYLLSLESIDVNVLDDRGKTALYLAIVNDRLEVVELIKEGQNEELKN